jgi:hypothetical protein
MKLNLKSVAIAIGAVACIGLGYRSFTKKRKAAREKTTLRTDDPNGEDIDPIQSPVTYSEDQEEFTQEDDVISPEEETQNLPFLEDAIFQAIKYGVDDSFFMPNLDDSDRSLSPHVKISRSKGARMLDLLFPVPMSIAMEGMDMGKYYGLTDGETKLPGPSPKEISWRLFKSAFDYKHGYVIPQILKLFNGYLDKSYETDLEGYYFVSYFVWDRESNKYVRKERLFRGVNYIKRREIDNTGDEKKKGYHRDKPLMDYLTEIFENRLDDPSKISNDIINPLDLEKGKRVKDLKINYVMLCYRISFVIADKDHPEGITPYMAALLFDFLENDLEISDGLSNSREFNYETPIIYEESAMEDGKFMVYDMNIENPDFPGTLTLFELDWDLREKDEAKMEANKK